MGRGDVAGQLTFFGRAEPTYWSTAGFLHAPYGSNPFRDPHDPGPPLSPLLGISFCPLPSRSVNHEKDGGRGGKTNVVVTDSFVATGFTAVGSY